MRGGVAAFLGVALLLGASLAGCLTPASPEPTLPATGPDAPWGTDLAEVAATPGAAVRRSHAERTADVAPPGSPQFAGFDAVVRAFLDSHAVGAASVAVLRDGKLRYQQGYGHLDDGGTKPTPPDALFRMASVGKPFTAAVATLLVGEGKLAWEDPVFCLAPSPAPRCVLGIEPHPARPVADERLRDLEVRHLVEHRTGWSRGPCTEPVQFPLRVAEDLGVPSPPPAWRLAQWFLGTPMEFDPGTDPNEGRSEPVVDRYCNMGYLLLGLVVEQAAQATLPALYEAHLFAPLEISGDIEPGRTRPEERNPREPVYACDLGKTQSIYDPSQEVCWADGGFDLEASLALGGLVATAAAIGAFYEAYENDGSPREPAEGLHRGGHGGWLPGTASLAWRLHEGFVGALGDVTIVVLFNRAVGPEFVPDEVDTIDAFQDLYVDLYGAYGGTEAGLPAVLSS